jgi:hypothetical protein
LRTWPSSTALGLYKVLEIGDINTRKAYGRKQRGQIGSRRLKISPQAGDRSRPWMSALAAVGLKQLLPMSHIKSVIMREVLCVIDNQTRLMR